MTLFHLALDAALVGAAFIAVEYVIRRYRKRRKHDTA
jgi:hypothetical protein